MLHARLAQLLAEKYSAGSAARTINEEFGTSFTRNAVISRANRKGLVFSRRPSVELPRLSADRVVLARKRAERQLRKEAAKLASRFKVRAEAEKFVASEPTDLPADTSPFACTIAELSPNSCRYPLGDPQAPDFRYCGARKMESSSYCARHHLLCWRVPDRRVSVPPAASVSTSFGLMQAAE